MWFFSTLGTPFWTLGVERWQDHVLVIRCGLVGQKMAWIRPRILRCTEKPAMYLVFCFAVVNRGE
jgi:hypothetical protein